MNKRSNNGRNGVMDRGMIKETRMKEGKNKQMNERKKEKKWKQTKKEGKGQANV